MKSVSLCWKCLWSCWNALLAVWGGIQHPHLRVSMAVWDICMGWAAGTWHHWEDRCLSQMMTGGSLLFLPAMTPVPPAWLKYTHMHQKTGTETSDEEMEKSKKTWIILKWILLHSNMTKSKLLIPFQKQTFCPSPHSILEMSYPEPCSVPGKARSNGQVSGWTLWWDLGNHCQLPESGTG